MKKEMEKYWENPKSDRKSSARRKCESDDLLKKESNDFLLISKKKKTAGNREIDGRGGFQRWRNQEEWA